MWRRLKNLLVWLLFAVQVGVPWAARSQPRVRLDLSGLRAVVEGAQPQTLFSKPGLKWVFLSPDEVFSRYLPSYLRWSWRPISPGELLASADGDTLRVLCAQLLDSLSAHTEQLTNALREAIGWTGRDLEDAEIHCVLFYHPTEAGPFWAGVGPSVAFSIRPYVRTGSGVEIRWNQLAADLAEACFGSLSSELLTHDDLLLETTGNHAAIREDLINRYGFGFVSLASRALGKELHHRDPDRLRELVDEWAAGASFDVARASRAAEFFRRTMQLGMAYWSSAALRGIPDSATYLFQLEAWLPALERDLEDFHKAFRLVVREKRVRPSGPLRELAERGVLRRLGFYMARRIEYVLGRDRLLRDFETSEVEFFLDYIALQEEADVRFDESVCLWAFDLASELDRLVRIASNR